jgi:hypothetical protein
VKGRLGGRIDPNAAPVFAGKSPKDGTGFHLTSVSDLGSMATEADCASQENITTLELFYAPVWHVYPAKIINTPNVAD